MKTANELKRFCKESLGMTSLRAQSSSGKGQWQGVWVPATPYKHGEPLTFTGNEFPIAFRQIALEVVYGEVRAKTFEDRQYTGGNVERYRMSLHAEEWEKAIELFGTRHPKMGA